MRGTPPGFVALLRLLPVPEAAKCDLRRRLGARTRHYHGAAHVALLWRRHCQLALPPVLKKPRWRTRIACAIAFHDAVHEPSRDDNEARSAALWHRAARRLPLPERRWVADAILATRDHLAAWPMRPGPACLARDRLLDLDLTPLGEWTAEFERNTTRLRLEAAHLSDMAWETARLRFLRRMAAARGVFRGRAIRARFGGRLLANLSLALSGAEGCT